MFNATDIPVDGFVHHVALHDGLMSGPLADLAATLYYRCFATRPPT